MKTEPGASLTLLAITAGIAAGRARERARAIGSHVLAARAEEKHAEATHWLGKVVGVKG